MSKYLVKCVETYRVDSEAEATQLIQEAKSAREAELVKYLSEHREVTQKGEVVDEYYRVTLTKAFTREKQPDVQVDIIYKVVGKEGHEHEFQEN